MSVIMTNDEIRRREEAVRQARHSNAMEGLRELPKDALVLDAYARGEIDAAEFAHQGQHSLGSKGAGRGRLIAGSES
jgi:hypothetical protein